MEQQAELARHQHARGRHSRVEIERMGRWYILRGEVDSMRTKCAVIQQIPVEDGARWIIDHIHVR